MLLFTACVVFFGAGPLFLEKEARLEPLPPPSAADVATARTLVRNIRTATAPGAEDIVLETDVDALNSALRLAARFAKGFRGELTTDGQHLHGTVSMPVPWWTGRRWLNVTGTVPPFEDGFLPSEVHVGRTPLPPRLALWLARVGANISLGDRIGDTVLGAARSMEIKDQSLNFRLSLGEMGQNGVIKGTFGALSGSELPTRADVERYYRRILMATEDGTLPRSGSFLPYVQFTLNAVLTEQSERPLPHRYAAAILGLAKLCGARELAIFAGELVAHDQAEQETGAVTCDETTLNGRIDTRRHFITSAALQAFSNTGFAVSIGEFKELYDTISKSSSGGFDFTDMAANLSGIRMSNVLMAQPASDWPDLLRRLGSEGDVIVAFDGIPQLLPRAAFEAAYQTVDSPAYRAEIARIETRIDALRLYSGP